MKFADKSGARFVIVLGQTERETNRAALRDLRGGAELSVALDDLDALENLLKEV